MYRAHRIALLLMVFLLVAVGCGERKIETVDRGNSLAAAIDSFYTSVEEGDVEARIALFADSAVMMPNHWTMTQGKEAIAAMIRGTEDAVFRLRDRTVVDMDIDGDLAYTVNSYYYTYHARGDSAQWHKTKNVHIWKRTAAGDWKLHLDIWNSDVPMAQFSKE